MAIEAALSIDGFSPREQANPATPEELAQALREADEAGLAVAPVGGGTQLDIGMPPARLDLAMKITGLNRIVEYEPADLTVTVEAGMRFADLQATLAEQGQLLALDPAVDDAATIGGIIATNASGPMRFAFGSARDLVIGTRVANADGSLTRAGGRVVKNVAGYDLNKLHIGALGTLGVIVELSFKLAPIPPSSATVVGQFSSAADAGEAAGAVVHSPLSALAIEALGSAAAAAAGLPRAHVLVFRVGGYPEAVQRQERELRQVIGTHRGVVAEVADSAWDELASMRRRALRQPLVVKAAAPIAASARVIELLEQALPAAAVWAHAGNGVAYAAADQAPSAMALMELRQQVRALGDNASLVIQRCPTALKRQIDVWGDPGGSVSLMRAIKARLDPKNTLNPGRYVGGI
jgi:glycolate oxidase FAD binding subunit